MKNGRYFNFRDICDQNLWDTGYLVKKLQGYRILRPPPPPPNGASFGGIISVSAIESFLLNKNLTS